MTAPRVLMAPGVHGARPNATVQLLVASLESLATVRDFRWRTAFTSHYNVLHIHWPEALLRHNNPAVAAAKKLAFVVLLARCRLLRIGTVWTVHNIEPHERGGFGEKALLRLWERTCSARVYMYPSAMPRPATSRDHCIPRGDYEPQYGVFRSATARVRPASLAIVGQLRPYKGIESFIEAFSHRPRGVVSSLVISGEPRAAGFGAHLAELASGVADVTVHLGHSTDEQLAAQIGRSHAVVLPYLRMYNSGVALLALTLGRPVIATDSPTMRDLRSEAGEVWVFLTSGTWDAAEWRRLATWLRLARPVRPTMPNRDWTTVGERYAALYSRVT